jgi:hypothetical protein
MAITFEVVRPANEKKVISVEVSPEELLNAPAPEEAPELDYLDRMGNIFKKRGGELAKTQADFESGEIGEASWALQTIGKGLFGTIADAVGETVSTGASEAIATILSEKTADQAEEWLKEVIASGTETLMSNDEAQEILAWYRGLDPQTRKNLESATNIAAGMLPPMARGNLKDTMKSTGAALEKSGQMSKTARQKKVLAKTALDNNPKAKIARANKDPNIIAMDNDILDTLVTVKGVKAGAKPQKNIDAIDVELVNLDGKVDDLLKKVTVNINPKMVPNVVRQQVRAIVDVDPSLSPMRKVNANYIKSLDEVLESHLSKYDGTLLGLRKLRTAFDETIKRESTNPDSVFHGTAKNSPFVKAYRDALNNIVDTVAERQGLDVKTLRSRQNKLINAKKNLAAMKDKTKGKWDKVKDFAKAHPYITFGLLNPANAGLLKAPAAVGALVGLTGYGAYKGLTSPAMRQSVGQAMQGVGTLAPTATRSMFYGAPEEEQ